MVTFFVNRLKVMCFEPPQKRVCSVFGRKWMLVFEGGRRKESGRRWATSAAKQDSGNRRGNGVGFVEREKVGKRESGWGDEAGGRRNAVLI